MKILRAITELLHFQKSASISEIAAMSGRTKMEVLTCLNLNDALIVKEIKGGQGRIIGLFDVCGESRQKAFDSGNTYVVDKTDYGRLDVIRCKSPKISHLYEDIWVGMYGDSHKESIIRHTEENIKAIKELGIIPYNEGQYTKIEDVWIETIK